MVMKIESQSRTHDIKKVKLFLVWLPDNLRGVFFRSYSDGYVYRDCGHSYVRGARSVWILRENDGSFTVLRQLDVVCLRRGDSESLLNYAK